MKAEWKKVRDMAGSISRGLMGRGGGVSERLVCEPSQKALHVVVIYSEADAMVVQR